MKKMLRVSLLPLFSIAVTLLPARAQAQMLCTLGPAAPFDSMADMPPSPTPRPI